MTDNEKNYAQPVAVDLDAYRESLPQPAGPAVVGDGETDEVFLSSIVYKNMMARRSLSVFHMQRRLAELGYKDAGRDPKGFYGDFTKAALAQFQAASFEGSDASGAADAQTLTALFDGDPNVTLVI